MERALQVSSQVMMGMDEMGTACGRRASVYLTLLFISALIISWTSSPIGLSYNCLLL